MNEFFYNLEETWGKTWILFSEHQSRMNSDKHYFKFASIQHKWNNKERLHIHIGILTFFNHTKS